ncbi:MAG: asparagine--tRNA ligase [Tissierellia bacterium]|nr:asparagine--tRNA ligase [Tissierellia bacterium]
MRVAVKKLFSLPEEYTGKEVIVEGWIRTARSSKNVGFIELNDGSCFKNMQIVYEDSLINFAEISKLPISSAIIVKGVVVSSPGEKQSIEIKAKQILVEGVSNQDYPLQKKRHTLEYLRTIAHLRPRSNTFSAVFRLRSVVAFAIHEFFQGRDFVYCHSPIITGSDAEGAGEMFHVTSLDLSDVPMTEDGKVDYSEDFFEKETNLTVSGQLEAEVFAQAFRNTYTFGPTFRAENSNTSRHAAEFWMIEPEIAFAELKDVMQLAEDMMRHIVKAVLEKCPDELEFFNRFVDQELLERLNAIVASPFARMTYTEAIDVLLESGKEFQYPVEWGMDLQTEHERFLCEEIIKGPVFVTDYPKDIKAFYMRLNEDKKTVAATDLLVPGVGEIIGGSQREEREDVLRQRMEDMGLDRENYWWYLELRKYGTTHHGGYGLGFERAIMYLTGISNIRDVIPFPRTVGSAEF